MFHADSSHSGTSNSTAPTTNQTLWGYNTQTPASWGSGPSPIVSSPAIVGGIVYFGSDSGIVYAVNASTGLSIWNFTTGYLYVRSSPAVSNGVVYIGDRRLVYLCLKRFNGQQKFGATRLTHIRLLSAVVDGVVYVNANLAYYGPGLNSYGILALNATTGTKIWVIPRKFHNCVTIGIYVTSGSQWNCLHWLSRRQRVRH